MSPPRRVDFFPQIPTKFAESLMGSLANHYYQLDHNERRDVLIILSRIMPQLRVTINSEKRVHDYIIFAWHQQTQVARTTKIHGGARYLYFLSTAFFGVGI